MLALIRAHEKEIAALCRRHHVRRLDVFGSAAREEDFDPETSDLDFLVTFETLDDGAYADAFFGLLHDLEHLFERRVDLVTERSLRNPYLIRSIEEDREALYAI